MKKLVTFLLLVISSFAVAQDIKVTTKDNDLKLAALPYYSYGKGLGITSPDSLFQLNIRFRMQNRVTYFENEGEDAAYSGEIRRLRLRFDGYVGNPHFLYVIQLSFAPGDVGEIQDGENINIIRDAAVFYRPNKHWSFLFGQTKLPGNRQRVNSSGALQLTDRSINNARFTIDRDFGLQAYYLNNLSEAEKTLEQALKVPGLPAMELGQIKIDLGDIYLLNKQPWEAVLIYEQVAKQYENLPIASEARFRSARLSFYQGNFKYAKSQADVLKASTSQLIANDALNLSLLISDNLQSKNDSLALMMYADAEMLQFLNNNTAAIKKLDSIDIAFPKNSLTDDVLMSKAKIYIKTSEFAKAEENLKELIANHATSIWIDDAIFTLADLYEHQLNNIEAAKKLYQQLITDFPGSMLNSEARKRYRNMRGDNLGA